MKPREDAIHLAAQCWCDEETSHKEMDSTLAMAFAKRLEVLMQERDSLKAQVEVALKAMETVHDNVIFDALEQIQKMRGGE